jgi:predicted permease
MSSFARDVRHTFHLLSVNRGFAAASLMTIALAVGGTSAIFSIVYGVLLRPLPYHEPDRVVRMWEEHPGARAPISGNLMSHPTYRAWTHASPSLQEIAAFRGTDYTVTGLGGARRLRGTRVTPSLFRVLRVSPSLGRFFIDADAEPGATPVVVLGHALWREAFGGDSAVTSRSLAVDGVDHQIVGVAPPGFAFPEKAVGLRDDRREIVLYTPYSVRPQEAAKVIDIANAVARLRPGATIAQTAAEGTAAARGVERPQADLVFGHGRQVEVRVRSLVDHMTLRVQPALLVMTTGVVLVLMIACANVANLFLSRGSDRRRELAVRVALGASRWRLIQQLLTESLIISAIGGALGIFVGWALIRAVPALAPADFPRLDEIRVDARGLGVSALAAIFVGAISGVVPALRASRIALAAAMPAAGGRNIVAQNGRLRRVLLAGEAALAMVLLVGAALVGRSFTRLMGVDPGYDAAGVVTADLRMPAGTDAPQRTWHVAVSALERIRMLPGVDAAGAGDMAPFGSVLSRVGFTLPGTTADGRPIVAAALRSVITPGYAEALGIRLKEGRLLHADDRTAAIRPMLVNVTFAKAYLTDGRPAIGRRFTGLFPKWLGPTAVVEIVGLVEDMLPDDLTARSQPQIFVAQGPGAVVGNATFVVKTAGSPVATASLLQGIVQQLEPGATLNRSSALADKIAASVGEQRFATSVLLAFAVLALALAATGLYGVLSFNVAQRRREIGVRAALGATRGALLRMVLRDGLVPACTGLAAGLGIAAIATRALTAVLFEVTPLDRVAFSASACLLLAVAVAACLLPARRAARIDPAVALRAE